MNHVYRLCWNHALRALVPASELATNHGVTGPSPSRRRVPLARTALAMSLVLCGAAWAGNAPTGGQIVGGNGQITQSGETTTIRQQSNVLSLDWQGFDIGAGQTVNFLQPGRDAIAVNRILGNTASDIQGHLNANGQVWLINPNGVLFGQNAQVNVGGLVASTLDVDDASIGSDSVRFAGNGRGSVVNRGSINVAPGGYAALLGNTVSNQGTIRAQLGTVALAGGTALTLTFSGTRLMHVVVDANAVKSLVENHQLIVANGGRVLMTAGARNALIASAVNNTGTVQARTVAEHDGVITLLSGMEAGTTNVAGTLDASAPDGGKGGFIETSGAQVQVADDARITTLAGAGKTGTWLIDPTNYTVAASGGDETGAHLASRLGSTNVTIESSTGTTDGGSNPGDAAGGNINVNDAVRWTSGNSLTLNATNNVNIEATVSGGAGSALNANAGNAVNIGAGGSVSVGQATITSSAFNNAAGATALGSQWTIRGSAASKASVVLGGLMPDFTQYHAGAGFTTSGTGNGVVYSTLAPTLTISNLVAGSSLSKGYDGTTTAYLNYANPVNADGSINPSPTAPGNVTVSGLESGDALQSIAVTSAYGQSARGTGLAVSIDPANISASGLSVTDANGAPAYGYQLANNLGATATSMTGSITQKLLEVHVVGNPTKTYNGTTFVVPNTSSSEPTAKDNNLELVGVAQGDSIDVLHATTINYADANAGTNKKISATFQPTNFKVTSGDLANYLLPTALPTNCSLYCEGTILKAPIYLTGLTAENKVYDGTTAATIDGLTANGFFGVISADAGKVSLNVPAGGTFAGTFAQRDIGTGLAVQLLGVDNLLAGTGAGNYTIKPDMGLTASITPRALTVTGTTVATKVYDATTAATLDTTAAALDSNVVAGDVVTLSSTGVAGAFAQADAGKNLAVTTSGFTLGGVDAHNYTLGQPSFTSGEIDPATLTISINGPIAKTYDGTAFTTLHSGDFTITGWVTNPDSSVQGGDIVQSTARYQQGGSDQPDAGTGLDIHDVVQVTDFANLVNGTKLSNYTWGTAGDGVVTATGIGTINPALLTGVIVNNPTKVYDGNTNATLGSNNIQLGGVLPGESITVNAGVSAAGTYTDKDAGTWAMQSNTGAITWADFTAGAGTLLSNYVLPDVFSGSGTITPAPLTCGAGDACITVNLTGHPIRYYDGTTNVTLHPADFTLNLSGFAPGEGAVINGDITGTFAQKDAGINIPVSAPITQADVSGTPTTDLGNYIFVTDGNSNPSADGLSTTVFGLGDIKPRTLTATITGNPTKTYNGSADADISRHVTMDSADATAGTDSDDGKGLIAGETLVVSPTATALYDSVDATDFNGAGTGTHNVAATLVPSNFTDGTGKVSNYVLPATATGQGSISKATLTVGGVTANDKVYDQTATATLDYSRMTLDGLVSSDVGNVDLDTSGVVANFTRAGSPTANVARTGDPVTGAVASQAVTTTGFGHTSTSGNKDLNYVWNMPSGLTATINPVALTIDGQVALNKQYDAGTGATLKLSNGTLVATGGSLGIYSGDTVGFGLNGATAVGDTVVNGGTFATANANSVDQSVADGMAGQITVTTNAFYLNGAQAGNYTLVQPTLKANIWRAPLTVTINGDPTKIYDGSSLATLVPDDFNLTGFQGGDSIKITQSSSANYGTAGNFIKDHNGGVDLGVIADLAVSDYAPQGSTLLSNYVLPDQATGTLGHIDQAPLNLVATRVYDGTTDAALSLYLTGGPLDTGVNGENLAVSGNGDTGNKDANASTPYTVTGFIVGDGSGAGAGLADNYLVGFSLFITPRPLTVALNGTSGVGGIYQKVYDGSTTYDNSVAVDNSGAKALGLTTGDYTFGALDTTPGSESGFVAGEGATITKTSGTYDSKNVANATKVTATLASGDFTANGGTDLTNYILPKEAVGNGKIIPKDLLNVALTGTREYDGTTGAYGSGVAGHTQTFKEVNTGIGSETLVVTGTGSVADAHVQTGNAAQSLTDSSGLGFANGTGFATNYNVTIDNAASQYTITPYTHTFAANRDYDTTSDVDPTLYAAGNVLATGVNNEVLALTGTAGTGNTNGTVASPNVQGSSAAPAKQAVSNFTVADGTAAGGKAAGLASDYNLSFDLTIKPLVLNLSGTREYDTTASADASKFGSNGVLNGGFGQTLTLTGSGVTGSKNVGAYSRTSGSTTTPAADSTDFGLGTLALADGTGGGLGINYTLVGGNDSFAITPATITLSVTITGGRQYDGTTTALAKDFGSNGVITTSLGETLDVAGQGTLNGVNVGTYQTSDGSLLFGDPSVGGIKLTDGTTGTTGKASNYNLTGGSFTVIPKILDLFGTRVYDGGKTADWGLFGNKDGTINGVTVGGVTELLHLGGSGLLSAKDVNDGTPYTGTGIAGATSGQGFNLDTLALTSGTGKASNYTLVGGTDSLILTPKRIIGTVSAPSRVYDGTTDAMVSFTTTIGDVIGGVISGDDVNVDVGSANFADKNAGNGKTVTASGITLSGADAGNYTINATATTTANIYRQVLNLGGTRVYDGTAVANAGNLAIVAGGLVPGETLGLSGAGVLSAKDVNGGTPYAGTGVAGATSGQGFNLGTLALTSGTGLASNYTLVGGSDSLTITPAVINLSGTRVYDQSTAADFSLFGHHDGTIDGVTVGGVTEVLGLKGSGALGSKNVNTYTRDPASTAAPAGATDFGLDTLALGDGTTGNGTTTSNGDLGNYTLIGGSDTLTITHKAITVDAAAANKVYDGTTTAGVVLGSTGVISGDTVNFASTDANFDDKNVGTGKTVTVDGISAGGTDAGNYTINTTAITTADITPYVLNLTGQRVYDTTAGADAKWFGNGDGTINGVTVGGVTEVLDLAGSGVSGSADVGTYARNPGSTTVPAAGSTDFGLGSLALGDNAGSLASNYTLVGGNDRFVITPAGVVLQLSIAGGRQYDGTTAALSSDFGKGGVITVLNGQTLNLTGQGTLTSANAGNYQTSDSSLLFGSIKLTDGTGKASNYTLTDGSFTVTQRVLGLSGTRVYDGSTNATASDITAITGLVTGETLGLTGTGVLSGKDVNGGTPYTGTGGAVGPQGFDLGTLALTNGAGGLASNYTLVGGSDALTITQRAISATFTGDNKVYDGTTVATVSGAALTQNGGIGVTAGTGLITGDKVTLTNPTQGSFADKNANTGITVTGDMGITGDDAGNYVFANGTATADITPKVLDLTGTRIYDTTTDAAAGDLKLGGLVGSETLVLGGQGGVTIKNVGSYTGGDFNLGSLGLADGSNGGLAGNYTLVGGTDTLTITPAPLTVSGITAASRTYDGTTAATVSGGTLHGVLGGDNVTLSVGGTGTFATPNAGTGIAVSVVTNLGGSDVGNYVLTSSGGAVADIYRKVLDLSGTRVYDGSTAADASDLAIIGGLVGSETLVLTGTGTLGDGNVGVAKPLAGLGTLALGNGGNGGLASNYTLAGGIDTLTITPYVLDLAGTRTYDGTTDADASSFGTDGMLAGLHGQTLQLTGTGSVADKNVGSDKPLTDLGTLALGDGTNGGLAGNYTLVGGIDTLTITPKTLTVVAVGTDKLYDGNTLDQVTLGTSDVLAGDSVQLRFGDARFSDPNIGRHKLVTVTGVQVGGADGGNYLLASPTVYTYADITGGQPAAFGIGAGTLAYLNSVVGPSQLATPYGSTTQDTVGTFNGNKQRRRQPVQRNGSRNDFTSGLALKVIDGGLRMPSTMAMP